jgi:secreted Zn-dependent insulinase-like peptidase
VELKSKGEDMPELRKIARRVINYALKGKENWSWAAKEIWDRLDGKATVFVTEEKEVRDVRDLSDDELNAIIVGGLTDDEFETLIARGQAAIP